VLVTAYSGDLLSLFSSEGDLVTRVQLPACSKARHAVQTLNHTLVVCRTLPRHDVIEVDLLGHVTRVYDAQLNWPRRLALAECGDVIVLDSGRVLLADDELRLKRVLLTGDHAGFNEPWRISYSSPSGLLVVGEAWKFDSRWTGRVTLFRLV